MTAYRTDGSWRRTGDGVVVAGSPLRLFRLTERGHRVALALERGEPLPPGHEPLTDRLVEAGAIHPVPPAGGGPSRREVTVVVPALDPTTGALERIVAACAGVARVVIVDDGSRPPIEPVPGAEVMRVPVSSNPGAARTAGLARVGTAIVAFVDVDVALGEGWLEPLLAHLSDRRVGLVAPRVASQARPGALAAYEHDRSPLDLGRQPAPVRAGTRVAYVPAAVLVCRADAVRAIGGFDTSLRVGEDVDLVWRLDEAGWACRYEPAVVVHHEPRPTLRSWLAQRAAYGRSAAPLAARHPGALAPLRVSGWSAAVWALAAAGHPVGAVATAAGTSVALARRLRQVPGGTRLAVDLTTRGHLFAGRQLASAITRAWWPLALALAVASRRARRVALAAAVGPAMIDWVQRRPRLDPVRYVALRVLDDAAYGTGVWRGAWRRRLADPLLPDLTSWPRTGRLERRRAARSGRRTPRTPSPG